MQEIVHYHEKNSYTQTFGECFIKCIICFTDKDYTQVFQDFIRNEKYRSGVMTSARVQQHKNNNNIGCFKGKEINPRNFTERLTSLFIYINQICLFWNLKELALIKQ